MSSGGNRGNPYDRAYETAGNDARQEFFSGARKTSSQMTTDDGDTSGSDLVPPILQRPPRSSDGFRCTPESSNEESQNASNLPPHPYRSLKMQNQKLESKVEKLQEQLMEVVQERARLGATLEYTEASRKKLEEDLSKLTDEKNRLRTESEEVKRDLAIYRALHGRLPQN